MAELSRQGDELVLTLDTLEKAESLHGDVRVPVSSVRDIEVVDDVIHHVSGVKLPGTRWPGKIAVGTFIAFSGTRTFAVIHHDQPRGLLVRLSGDGFDEIVIGCADPEAMKERLGDLPVGEAN